MPQAAVVLMPPAVPREVSTVAVTGPTDAELMARIARKDSLAFRLLAGRHIGRGHAIAMRVTRNAEDAEEAVQDALGRVWHNAGRFEPGRARFGTWFYSIVSRCALDRLRRRPPVADDIDDHTEDLSDSAENSEAAWLRRKESKRIETAVAGLPPQQKLAVILCYYEDFTQPEAARIMNIHPKALEGLLFRARKALRPILES